MLRLHIPEAKNPLVVTSLASGGSEPVPYGLIRAPNSRTPFLFFFPLPLSTTILFLFSLRHNCSRRSGDVVDVPDAAWWLWWRGFAATPIYSKVVVALRCCSGAALCITKPTINSFGRATLKKHRAN